MNDIATVQDLIDYLKNNFKSTDKLCFWCEGGAWLECEHLPKSELGKMVFKTVKEDKDSRLKYETDKDLISKIDEDYKTVNDNDIIVY